MPTFDTPGPIVATLDIGVGNIEITAVDRAEASVEVRPTNPDRGADGTAADRVRVGYADGALTVKLPKQHTIIGKPGSLDVTVALPAGSQLRCSVGMASVRTTGRLGDCRVKTGAGDIELDETATVEASSGAGDIAVRRATGRAGLTAGAGSIRLRHAESAAVLKTSTGDIWVGDAAGELHARSAQGDIAADRAAGAVVAKTSMGSLRIGELAGGTASLDTSMGDVEVGIPAGVAAWLDASTKFGQVRHALSEVGGGPVDGERRAEVLASTGYGDIAVNRC